MSLDEPVCLEVDVIFPLCSSRIAWIHLPLIRRRRCLPVPWEKPFLALLDESSWKANFTPFIGRNSYCSTAPENGSRGLPWGSGGFGRRGVGRPNLVTTGGGSFLFPCNGGVGGCAATLPASLTGAALPGKMPILRKLHRAMRHPRRRCATTARFPGPEMDFTQNRL